MLLKITDGAFKCHLNPIKCSGISLCSDDIINAWLCEELITFFLLLNMFLNLQFVLFSPHPPTPNTHMHTRLHPPFRTKCAECGHSSGAGLPSTVRVSETPLSCIQHKGGSTLSLDAHPRSTARFYFKDTANGHKPFKRDQRTSCHLDF